MTADDKSVYFEMSKKFYSAGVTNSVIDAAVAKNFGMKFFPEKSSRHISSNTKTELRDIPYVVFRLRRKRAEDCFGWTSFI